MIAARLLMLLLAAMGLLGATGVFGAGPAGLQPSAQRLAVSAVFGLLAPLFWPGRADTARRSGRNVIVWSAAVTVLALVTLMAMGQGVQRWPGLAATGLMLLAILLLCHGVAALLEGRGHDVADAGRDGLSRRARAGQGVAVGLALLGALPLWLGPLAERVTAGQDTALDAIVGLSPLTHLAVAAGNDLLRNPWFYQHANLAGLRVAYPEIGVLAWCYAAAALALALALRAAHGGPRQAAITKPIATRVEQDP